MIRHPASLRGVPVAPVPPLLRYYQDATTSCLPSRRTSFPSLGGTTVASAVRSLPPEMPGQQARCVSLLQASPSCLDCRGEDRTSQVPARPQSPVCTCSSTPAEPIATHHNITPAWPPLRERRGLPQRDFRSSIAWLPGSLSTLRRVGYPKHHARLAFGRWLNATAWDSHPQGLNERFQLLTHHIPLSQA